MEHARAMELSKEIIDALRPYCQHDGICIAGSVRRYKRWCNDIDIVLIPGDDPFAFNQAIMQVGEVSKNGPKIKTISYKNNQVDLYIATPENWATLLLIRTGSKEHNQYLCGLAQKKGWHLAANGDGLFDENGKRIAGDSEDSIFTALGLKYVEPQKRER